MGDESGDRQLVERLRGGDRGALGELAERHGDLLVGTLTRLCGCPERARDLAQETLVRFWTHANGYREEGKLAAYLVRIATNLLRSEERRRRRWLLLTPRLAAGNGVMGHGGRLPSGPPAGGAEAEVVAAELRREVRRQLSALPLRYRVPLVLAEVEEWSYRDIAVAMGCREGTVKSRIFRGKERLRAALAPYLEGE